MAGTSARPHHKDNPEALCGTEAKRREFKEAAAYRTIKLPDGDVLLLMDVETEIEADTSRGIIKGYANTKGVWDSYNDIGLDGCYKDAIRDGFETPISEDKPPAIKVLYQHKWSEPIGLPDRMEEDSTGLYTESRIIDPTEGLGRRVLVLADEGVLDSFSIGFRLKRSDYRWLSLEEMSAEDIAALPANPLWYPPREILRYRIFEYSIVTFAANTDSRITEVIKSLGQDMWTGWDSGRRAPKLPAKGTPQLPAPPQKKEPAPEQQPGSGLKTTMNVSVNLDEEVLASAFKRALAEHCEEQVEAKAKAEAEAKAKAAQEKADNPQNEDGDPEAERRSELTQGLAALLEKHRSN